MPLVPRDADIGGFGPLSRLGRTLWPCRSPSPKTTVPWARRPRTSSPSTTPSGPPAPCSRPDKETLPPFWSDLAELGWLGLHLPEAVGGSGYGLPELVVVVEELGRALTPGPFVPTVIASAVIDAVGSDELRARVLPGLADGSACGGVALSSDITVSGGTAAGTAPAVLGGGLANVLVLPAGDDAIVVDAAAKGVTVEVPANLDPTRRTARVTLDGAAAEVIPGGARVLVDLARDARRRRGGRGRDRVHRAGRGLRQGAGAVRASHRDLPGRQAPLRQHGRGLRARHRRRVGRGAGGR